MRSAVVFLAALAALGEAASIQKCAGACVIKGIEATGCSSVDSSCICASDAFLSSVKTCVPEQCAEDERESAVAYAQDFCHKIELARREAKPKAAAAKREAQPAPAHEEAKWWGGKSFNGLTDWWKDHKNVEWAYRKKHHYPAAHHHKAFPTTYTATISATNTVMPYYTATATAAVYPDEAWPEKQGWGHEGGWGEKGWKRS